MHAPYSFWRLADGDLPAVGALLLEGGADIQARNEYDPVPLHNAAKSNNGSVLAVLLLDRGSDTETLDEFGGTSLHFSAWSKEEPIFQNFVLTVEWKSNPETTLATRPGIFLLNRKKREWLLSCWTEARAQWLKATRVKHRVNLLTTVKNSPGHLSLSGFAVPGCTALKSFTFQMMPLNPEISIGENRNSPANIQHPIRKLTAEARRQFQRRETGEKNRYRRSKPR